MSMRNNPHRSHRRSHPRLSPQREQQSAADAGEGFSRLFQGAAFDPSLCDFAPRGFDPTMKRWADQEPLAYVDGINVYMACADNPIHRVQPAGDSMGDEGGY